MKAFSQFSPAAFLRATFARKWFDSSQNYPKRVRPVNNPAGSKLMKKARKGTIGKIHLGRLA